MYQNDVILFPTSSIHGKFLNGFCAFDSQINFQTNIDIRDTVKYKEVMTQYGLGPNGAIMTSLNLFSTKFDQVLEIVEKRASSTDHVIIDTPGQIEVFTWSASGSIITETLATTIPTVVLYVMDVAKGWDRNH